MKERREKAPCEAPEHKESCPCLTCEIRDCQRCKLITRDHFTGQAIGKVWGQSRKKLNGIDEWLWLSKPCHQAKDAIVPCVLDQIRQQKEGKLIKFGEHITTFPLKTA